MINFETLSSLQIPEGVVKVITNKETEEVLWKNKTINHVPFSIDTDGSIYNGTGYIDGYRLSSSGAIKTQNNSVTTGFIKATEKDLVIMSGVKWNETTGYNYFAIYDENYTLLSTINYNGEGVGKEATHGWSYGGTNMSNSHVYVENDITRFEIVMDNNVKYAYIRISAYGSGANMTVMVQ